MWENVRFSMNSTMPLFFVMLLGYVLYQKKFLSDAFVAGANKFVFYVALPVQLFRDLAATDVRAAFDGAYVLFCFVVTLVSILGIWALAKLFLPDKRLVGEFVQVCYRSSAAILGTAFLQSIYGTAEFESSINPAAPANRIITSVFSPTRFLFLLHYGIAYVEKVNDEGIKRTEKHVMRYPQLFATMAVGRVLAAGGGAH